MTNISTVELPCPNPTLFRPFTVRFYDVGSITTVVTSNSSVAGEWVQRLTDLQHYYGDRLVVGLSVQGRNYPRKSGRVIPLAATLQLCCGPVCLIFQIDRRDSTVPRILVDFLASPRFVFVGIENYNHSQMLTVSDPALHVNAVELRRLARGEVSEDASFEEMVKQFLVPDYVHPLDWLETTDWSAAQLS